MEPTGRVRAPALPHRAAPFYVHPAVDPDAWCSLLAGGLDLSFAVVNVRNGPGSAPDDPYYGPLLRSASHARLVGYVRLDYGRRPWSAVLEDVRRWREWYAIDSVMLDECPSASRDHEWRVERIEELRQSGARFVAANAGTVPHRSLLEAADVTCVAELAWADYERLELPGWLSEVPPGRQWHLVHDVPPARIPYAARLAGARGAGHWWGTSGTLPDPWASLPVPFTSLPVPFTSP